MIEPSPCSFTLPRYHSLLNLAKHLFADVFHDALDLLLLGELPGKTFQLRIILLEIGLVRRNDFFQVENLISPQRRRELHAHGLGDFAGLHALHRVQNVLRQRGNDDGSPMSPPKGFVAASAERCAAISANAAPWMMLSRIALIVSNGALCTSAAVFGMRMRIWRPCALHHHGVQEVG